jgi:hypothetical protein
MSFLEEIIATIFQDIILVSIRVIGSFVRWIFLKHKFTFKEIRSQSWNGRME